MSQRQVSKDTQHAILQWLYAGLWILNQIVIFVRQLRGVFIEASLRGKHAFVASVGKAMICNTLYVLSAFSCIFCVAYV